MCYIMWCLIKWGNDCIEGPDNFYKLLNFYCPFNVPYFELYYHLFRDIYYCYSCCLGLFYYKTSLAHLRIFAVADLDMPLLL